MRLVRYRGKYAAYVRGRRISLRTADRGEAQRQFADLKKKFETKKESIGEIVKAYLEEKQAKSSIKGMQDAWKYGVGLRPEICSLRPDQLSREICRVYISKRQTDGISNGTIRKELGVLRQALRWQDPSGVFQIELPPAPAPTERYLTKEEYKKLLDHCDTPHLKLFVQLALATAGRKSAILELTWDRVDFTEKVIRLSRGVKSNKGRATVPMTEILYKALLMAKERASCDYVVEYGGKRVKNIAKGFRETVRKAGLKDVTPHTLRHTAACWMAMNGTPMEEIAKILGHTTPLITYRVYIKFSPTHLRKAISALEVE